jgi:hypothetical protein
MEAGETLPGRKNEYSDQRNRQKGRKNYFSGHCDARRGWENRFFTLLICDMKGMLFLIMDRDKAILCGLRRIDLWVA